jgi:hypothetical protein
VRPVLQMADYRHRPLLRPRTKRDAAVIVPNPAMESHRHMPLASSPFGERIAVVGVWELARFMHHASRFCPPGWRTHAVGPSVWVVWVNSLCNALGVDLPHRRLAGARGPTAYGPA